MFELLWWEWLAVFTALPIGIVYMYYVEKARLDKEMEEFRKQLKMKDLDEVLKNENLHKSKTSKSNGHYR